VLTTYYAAEAAYDPNAVGVVHGWRLADLRALVQAVRDRQADVLHIVYSANSYNFETAIFLLPLLLRMTGWRSPIVTTVDEYGQGEWQFGKIPLPSIKWLKLWGQHRQWWNRENGYLLTLSDAVIATSTDVKAAIHQHLPLKNSIFHIPVAANVDVASIEPTTARQMLRKNCQWPDDTVAIAFFGFLQPGKGLETLLKAFKQVWETHSQVRLLLVGGGESLACSGEKARKYWFQLQTLIAELGLLQLVHFTNYISAETVSHYLTGADIGVLPGDRGVTLNSTLLTLLAHGLPIVATQSQTSPAARPVQFVPPQDVNALVVALLELLDNSVKRAQLSAASRIFGQSFAWEHIAKAHLDIYSNLVTSLWLKKR
jgi:glycosyltransferase involved in cell wall biosynthesis